MHTPKEVSIPKRVSEVLKLKFLFLFTVKIYVSIPKRVSEVLKPHFEGAIKDNRRVSIPKRVSEVLKPKAPNREFTNAGFNP